MNVLDPEVTTVAIVETALVVTTVSTLLVELDTLVLELLAFLLTRTPPTGPEARLVDVEALAARAWKLANVLLPVAGALIAAVIPD